MRRPAERYELSGGRCLLLLRLLPVEEVVRVLSLSSSLEMIVCLNDEEKVNGFVVGWK